MVEQVDRCDETAEGGESRNEGEEGREEWGRESLSSEVEDEPKSVL